MITKEELELKLEDTKLQINQKLEETKDSFLEKKSELNQKLEETKDTILEKKTEFNQKLEENKKIINDQIELTKLQVEKKIADTKYEIDQKIIETPLNDYHNLSAYANQVRLPFLKSLMPYMYQVTHNFFFLQLKQALHISKIPVIYVDTPLDDRIPFIPEKVNIYMDFVPFFLRPILMLSLRVSTKKSAKIEEDFMKMLSQMYRNTASIYRFCMTTTHRPKYFKGKFKTIHAFDPHLLCVPSLHVTICTVTYAYYKSLRGKSILPEQELEDRIAEIRSYAIQIIESVLFVKQHSVNCIPAAIYMVTATTPEGFFTADDAHELINSIFLQCSEMPSDLRTDVVNHFLNFFDRCYEENKTAQHWQDPIKNWLIQHAKETNQPLKVKA